MSFFYCLLLGQLKSQLKKGFNRTFSSDWFCDVCQKILRFVQTYFSFQIFATRGNARIQLYVQYQRFFFMYTNSHHRGSKFNWWWRYIFQHPEKDISLLFCGDFNSTPEFGVYRFMKTQFIDVDDPDWNSSKFTFWFDNL